jgi:hypothetical protein
MGYNTLTVTFDTINDLVNYTGQQPNEQVNVLGYYAPGDEGGGTFYWDASSTQTQDLGTIFNGLGLTTGRWKRIFTESIYVRWFGISPTDFAQNTINFQKAVNVAADIYPLRLGEGTITMNGSISFTKSPRVYGAGSYKTTIKNVSTNPTDNTFSIYDASTSTPITWGWLEGFAIRGTGEIIDEDTQVGNGNGICCQNCGRISFTDIISISNGKSGFCYYNSWTPLFTLCRAEGNLKHGVELVGNSSGNVINGAIFVTGSFSRNYGSGIYVNNGVAGTPALSAYSVTCSGNVGCGIEATSGSAITLVDPYFEYNGQHHICCYNDAVGQIKALNIVGSGFFHSDSTQPNIDGKHYAPAEFIYLKNVQNVKIEKASFQLINTVSTPSTAIYITGDCDPVIGEISKSIVAPAVLITHNLPINSGELAIGEVLSRGKRYSYLSDQWWLSLGKGSTGTEMMEGAFASDNGGERAVLSFAKSAGSLSAMSDITAASDIASILFKSYEAASASFKPIAEIKGSATGAQTSTSKPSKIEFQTAALNTITRRPAFIVRPDGLVELPVAGSGIVLKQTDGVSQTVQLTTQGELVVVNKPRTLSGSADPTVTPNFLGQMYINTTAKTVFIAVGTSSSADWKSV